MCLCFVKFSLQLNFVVISHKNHPGMDVETGEEGVQSWAPLSFRTVVGKATPRSAAGERTSS